MLYYIQDLNTHESHLQEASKPTCGGYLNTNFVYCICFRSYAIFLLIKCRILLNAGGSTRSFSLWPPKKWIARKLPTKREGSNLLTPSAMAPAGMELSCTKGGCQFVTPDMKPALALVAAFSFLVDLRVICFFLAIVLWNVFLRSRFGPVAGFLLHLQELHFL